MAELAPVKEQLDSLGRPTGVEKEEVTTKDGEKIAEPFDPDDIDVVTRSMTVDLLLSRAESGMIDLQPDFQRRWGVWDARRQSRLIESLLLRIPLPVLYAAEDEDESWEIVDGIQRLSTIVRFIKPATISSEPLLLTDLEYLSNYEGKDFQSLSSRLQMRLRETELVIHLIRKGTPPEVKFNIFARINTGGMPLSSQELRHAITPGTARKFLEELASLPIFLQATDNSVKPIRMDDRELALRFVAFFTLGLEKYKQPDMDGFLLAAMKAINISTASELALIKSRFVRAMETATSIFERDAFRKRFKKLDGRMPINKAVFEAVSVSLARLSDKDLDVLQTKKEFVKEGFISLCLDRDFESAISQGTGDVRKVNRRFAAIESLFRRVIADA